MKIRNAFTLIELLVVMAIIGTMISMMMPGLQGTREAARRNECGRNLSRIGLALQNYESAHESFPTGVTNPAGPIRSEPHGQHLSWIVRCCPISTSAMPMADRSGR